MNLDQIPTPAARALLSPPPIGGSAEIAPGVRWLRLGLPVALDHVNLWALADGPGWTIVDTGIHHPGGIEAWERILQNDLAGRPVTRVVVTHSMLPTLEDGDTVLVDMSQKIPQPPGIFVLHDGLGLVAKRLEHVPMSDPPRVQIISDNTRYPPYDCSADEVNIVGRIRWYGREMF